ncbi:MAG: FAD-dependent oxidoreductase [Vicinamibacterales bacterium]
MKRIAVIGSGIAGMAAAHLLSRRHMVWLFEKDTRLGGHTHTIPVVDASGTPLALDTGFLVHNARTYPNLVRLFRELNVETCASDMSFGVHCPRSGFEYSSRGLRGFFAQPRNRVRPGHFRLLADILRFNREATTQIERPDAEGTTIGDFLESRGFDGEFVERYLYPMTSAIWSASFDGIRQFPVLALVRFLANHGMLSVGQPPAWRTVRGGSARYIDPLVAPFRDRIRLGAEVTSVARCGEQVVVTCAGRPPVQVDEVVFATHGDQVLPVLKTPTAAERQVLSAFTTTRNDTWLHTDSSWLPVREAARASWNYRLSTRPSAPPSVTYHLNRLQRLETTQDFLVTLNPDRDIAPDTVVRRMSYSHPLYTRAAVAAQARWNEISGRNRIHYCGAYWYYGFHEDGLRSALRVADTFGIKWGHA